MRDNSRKPYSNTMCWIAAIAVNAVILFVVTMLSDVYYETNDDFAIAQQLSDGYPYVGFVNYFLCRFLIAIQGLSPNGNIFVLAQIFFSFVALTVILKVFISRSDRPIEIMLSGVICLIFSFDHYSSVQFTKTAALIMTSGLLVLADNHTNERKKSAYAAGFFLFFLGVAFRQKGMFPALSFAAGFILIWLILNRKERLTEGRAVKEVTLIILCAIVSVVPYGLDKLSDGINSGTAELKNAREYQAQRVLVTDYPLLKYYEQSEAEYESIGIDENDLTMINRWIFDYDGAASIDNLRAINAINEKYVKSSRSIVKSAKKAIRSSFYSLMEIDFTGLHIMIALMLVLVAMALCRPRTMVYIMFFAALTVVIYAAVYYMQRPQYRALYLSDESVAFWMMYAILTGEKRAGTRAGFIMTGIAVVIIAAMTVPTVRMLDASCRHSKSWVEDTDLLTYIEEHNENFYIGPTTTMGMPRSYATPLKKTDCIAKHR